MTPTVEGMSVVKSVLTSSLNQQEEVRILSDSSTQASLSKEDETVDHVPHSLARILRTMMRPMILSFLSHKVCLAIMPVDMLVCLTDFLGSSTFKRLFLTLLA